MEATVIGAGIGGLAIAIRLAVAGYDVTVFEKNNMVGGKLSEVSENGYRFDTGPSLFTLPELVKELFELCGEQIEEHLPYVKLQNNCRYFFPDGTIFNFYQDKEKLTTEVNEKTIDFPETLFNRLNKSEEVYNLGAPVFLFTDFHNIRNFNTPPYKKVATQLYKLDFFRTMHTANKHDFKDSRLVQLFDRYATYNGSSPYKAPATLNMIAHLENNIGAFFPVKGMYSIIRSLYELAVRQGIQFKFNTPVKHILTENKKAVGVTLEDGEKKYSDLVVSGIDVKQVAFRLLEKHPLKKRLSSMQPSSSALIFYWGINRSYPELDLHNILFTEDYPKEFDAIFKKRTIYNDPTIYLFISSKQVKGDAPVGCENWFVMINVPSDSGQNWEILIREARDNIIRKINLFLNTEIEKYIVTEHVGSPLTIEKNTGSVHGALYGTSSNSMFSAFLRHPNYLPGIKNLYFVGGSAHPGGGIPLCLASAKIVSNEINRIYGK